MYLYWRIQQDLNTLGEVIRFHDPSLIRSLRIWVGKKSGVLAMAEDRFPVGPCESSLN